MATLPPLDTVEKPSAGNPSWLRRATPTAIVMVALAGIAYWGHRTEWRFVTSAKKATTTTSGERKFRIESESVSTKACQAHGLPGCPNCNPKLGQLQSQPQSTQADQERIRRAIAARERTAGDSIALCTPRTIRFESAEAVDEAGIDITPAWTSSLTETVNASAEVSFHPTKQVRLTARAPGTAWRVFRQAGDIVRAGDILALIDSAEVGKAKAEFQVALVQERLKSQALKNLAGVPVQERFRKEAEAALKEAEIRLLAAEQSLGNLGIAPPVAELRSLNAAAVADRLQLLGVPKSFVESDGQATVSGNLLPVRATMDGIVLRTSVVAGDTIDIAKVLFHIVDPRLLRLNVHVAPADARWVKLGQSVRFRPDGENQDAIGTVTWIGTTADETTRTIPVWVDLLNPDGGLRLSMPLMQLIGGGMAIVANRDGGLRASMLGTGRVVLREEPDADMIPAKAVHAIDGSQVVFVRDKDFLEGDGPKRFHVRVVMLGARDGVNVEIVAGLLPGEVVATKGSQQLAEEVRKAIAASGSTQREQVPKP